ncbi:MAG: c-type cytochrome [Alphaproteobacteria bacterium]
MSASLMALALVLSPLSAATAHESKQDDEQISGLHVSEAWLIRKGGRMYANWADELGSDLPDTTHPSYPGSGKKKGETTWRCKECHGWDYMGVDGAYGSGGHYTGIKGIDGMLGGNPETIMKIIRDKTHRYTEDMIPDEDLEALALFVSWGQVVMDQYIDRKTHRAIGDVRHGAAIFQTTCAVCHGLNGKLIDFGSEGSPEFIGTVANENPWETLHNIRFGHAGDAMIGLIAFPVQDQVDALAYAQTLPVK